MTPEPAQQKLKLAHPGTRFQAQFLDGLVTLGLFLLVMYLSGLFDIEAQLSDFLILSIPAIYFVFSDALPNGQSVGKIFLGLSVVSKTTGKTCTILQSFMRNFLTPVLGVIDAVLIFTKKRQRLGDLMANTVVIKK